jgi:hypothetical protein
VPSEWDGAAFLRRILRVGSCIRLQADIQLHAQERQGPARRIPGYLDIRGVAPIVHRAEGQIPHPVMHPGGLMIDARALKTTLAREGYLIRGERDRFDGLKWCQGHSERVLHLRRDALGELGEAPSEATPSDGDVAPPNR